MKRLDESGFSLIELVVVIAMVAIISAIAIPNMIGWRGERQLRGAVNNLLGKGGIHFAPVIFHDRVDGLAALVTMPRYVVGFICTACSTSR